MNWNQFEQDLLNYSQGSHSSLLWTPLKHSHLTQRIKHLEWAYQQQQWQLKKNFVSIVIC